MESRQSRILGENIRLLTFVSIFFLPLGFCVVSLTYIFCSESVLNLIVTLECTNHQF